MRENTERPITLSAGTNRLVGTSRNAIIQNLDEVLAQGAQPQPTIPLWDGQAGKRIAKVLLDRFGN